MRPLTVCFSGGYLPPEGQVQAAPQACHPSAWGVWPQGSSSITPPSPPLLTHLGPFHHFQPLQGLENPTGHALGASAEVAGHDTVSLTTPIDLGHGADPSAAPEV